MTQKDELKRYRDGLWIQNRKRAYLYWFKFLQEAEQSEEYVVLWDCYEEWGGRQIVDMKFDVWWEAHWKDLFGYKKTGDTFEAAKFKLSTNQMKTDAMRKALLVWQNRDAGRHIVHDDKRKNKGRNMLVVAGVVVAKERRAKRNSDRDKLNKYLKNIDEAQGIIQSMVQQTCGRYLRQAQAMLEGVCRGRFP